jgi:hypothetical protein
MLSHILSLKVKYIHRQSYWVGIISLGFDITAQLLIQISAFVRHWRKVGVKRDSTSDFKKTYDSVMRQALSNILIDFGAPMKLV